MGHFALIDVQKSCSPDGVEHQWQDDIAVQLKEVGMPEQIEATASVGDDNTCNVSSNRTNLTTGTWRTHKPRRHMALPMFFVPFVVGR